MYRNFDIFSLDLTHLICAFQQLLLELIYIGPRLTKPRRYLWRFLM